MKLLIFGGTTEGRVLARRLAEAGAQVTVSVATAMGAEELADIPGLAVLTGRRDAVAMQALLQDFDLCIDATHPYAAEASANIRVACTAAGVPLRRGRSSACSRLRTARRFSFCTAGTAGFTRGRGGCWLFCRRNTSPPGYCRGFPVCSCWPQGWAVPGRTGSSAPPTGWTVTRWPKSVLPGNLSAFSPAGLETTPRTSAAV